MAESTSDPFESDQESRFPECGYYYDPADSSQTYQESDCVPSSLLSSQEGQCFTDSTSFDEASCLRDDQSITSQWSDNAILPGTASACSDPTGSSGHHVRAIPESYTYSFPNPIKTQTSAASAPLLSRHTTSGWSNYRTDGSDILSGSGSWVPGPQPFIDLTDSGANHSFTSPNTSSFCVYSSAGASAHNPEQASGHTSSDVSNPPDTPGSAIDESPSRNIPCGYTVDTDHRRLARHHTTNSSIKYFCTFCRDRLFKDKDTWRRHERCHFPETEYVCSPRHPVLFTPDGERCAFCNAKDPDPVHLAGHKAQSCDWKKEKWARKDIFVRHLKTQHGVSNPSKKQLEMWSNKPAARVLGCGFCVMAFNDPNGRLSHMAQHLDDGCTRADWDLCKVVRSLLSQPRVALDWQAVLHECFSEQNPAIISWSNEVASALQKRLEDGEESGRELALAALRLCQSSSCVVENTCTTSRDGTGNVSGSYHDIFNTNQFAMTGAQLHGYNYFAKSAGDYEFS